MRVAGDIDVLTAPQLKAALLEHVPNRRSPLVLDVSRVPFIDSTGLRVLFQVAARLQGDLVLLHPSVGVERLLRLTGAEQFPGLKVVYRPAA
jgi:anti-anti-sigma factor